MNTLNATHNPSLTSWVAAANQPDQDFPIQNLPFGVFTTASQAQAHVGVAIGDAILDLAVLQQAGLINVAGDVFNAASLNLFINLGAAVWSSVRAQVSDLLRADNATLRDNAALRSQALVAQSAAQMLLPVEIGGYTDFYSSKEHATNVGSMFRDPKNALLPNWLEIPIGYNGRASSVIVSDTPIRRPNGQTKAPTQERPEFGPCKKLDIELETGFIIGRGNALGEPIRCENAEQHIFGMVLLNDWSARDIQTWEYVPLGPFNSKTFASTISPWVVTMEALAPFRVATPAQEPQPLSYLQHKPEVKYGVDIQLEVQLTPEQSQQATTICRTNFKDMYWSMAQQLTHHTASGCNTRIGDLMGSGTISGATPDSFGSLLELTWNGANPLALTDGSTRQFIQDGDELTIRGWAQGANYRVGFGLCRGKILPALAV
ncbi:fumarylacetoacetase [Solimicrobium silvestre]|uniref:fumarylacetoacetase n=1 Tax=Solimicrobium silvestre TaxID=2099400 RepID=A0A2S9GUB2_9BURK|nr:fumarylacetoacetase [Solimicrobium silvestre]PRC91294.1 Fumarylacetoacetase [Solimicrobium silvestre]